jgi:hypothetical protein
MPRSELLSAAWGLPLWLTAAYNWIASVYFLSKARRAEYRTGAEPFIVWRDNCLTTEGLALRRRGTRAMRRFVVVVGVAVLGGWLLDSLGVFR